MNELTGGGQPWGDLSHRGPLQTQGLLECMTCLVSKPGACLGILYLNVFNFTQGHIQPPTGLWGIFGTYKGPIGGQNRDRHLSEEPRQPISAG